MKGLHQSAHSSSLSSLLQVVGTGWGGPCFWCQPPRGPGMHRGAQPQRSPSCCPTCALSPGKGLGWPDTPSPLNLLAQSPGQDTQWRDIISFHPVSYSPGQSQDNCWGESGTDLVPATRGYPGLVEETDIVQETNYGPSNSQEC